MNAQDWLIFATSTLKDAGIGTARLDAVVLLEDTVNKDRAWLLAHPEFILSPAQRAKLEKLLKRRATHEPLAYIRGKTEFYGRAFLLNADVLEPRPESEMMVDLFKEIVRQCPSEAGKGNRIRVADVGTGSGALGITAQLEVPSCVVELLDIDKKALNVAKMNVDNFTLNISVIESDLLQGSDTAHDILLCNLPYVPDDFHVNPAAMREPKIAIFGGPDGLDVYRKLFKQTEELTLKPLYILTESLPPQHQSLTDVARLGGYHLYRTDAFIQVFRREGSS